MAANDTIEGKVRANLNNNLLMAKRDLLLFVRQTKETIKYKQDSQKYIIELLADYSRLSENKNGTINGCGSAYINSGCPVVSDDELLDYLHGYCLHFIPKFGEDMAMAIAGTDAYLFLERYCKYKWLQELLQQLKAPQQPKTAASGLPVELQTDEAIRRFARAEEAGIIVKTATGYRKNNITKAQLAYFLRKIYQPNAQSGGSFPDAALSNLFGEARLGKASSQLIDNKKTDGKPKGYEVIDRLFID